MMPRRFGLRDLGGGGGSLSLKLPNPMDAYYPTLEQVQQAEEERAAEGGKSVFGEILDIFPKVFGAYSVKGGLKGLAEGGLEGAVKGVGEGYAWLTDALGVTDDAFKAAAFSEVRTAFGMGDQTQSGFANFAINLAGEILLDPSTWVQPFGLIGGAAKAGQAVAGLKKAVDLGQRAAVVWKFPGFDPVPLIRNLGMKSMGLDMAGGLDNLFGALRVSPVTGPLMRAFSNRAPAVRDPAIAGRIADAGDAYFDSREQVKNNAMKILSEYVPPSSRKVVLNDPVLQRIIFAFRELGLTRYDDAHAIENVLLAPAERLHEIRRAGLLKSDTKLRDLWGRAFNLESPDAKAFETLYLNEKIAIPQNLLDMYGAKPRTGIDVGAQDFQLPTTAEYLEGVSKITGRPLSEAEAARLAIGRGGEEAAVRLSAREQLVKDFRQLMEEAKTNPEKLEIVRQHVEGGIAVMQQIGDAEIASGILNTMYDFYVHRTITPAAREGLHGRFMQKVNELGGDGINTVASFMQGRKLHDMLTFEVNAMVQELGTKFTNFVPLKELEEHGADAVLGRIFDVPWLRTLARSTGDNQVFEFFSTNPWAADFKRIDAAAQVAAERSFFRSLLANDSPAVIDIAEMGNVEEMTRLSNRALNEGKVLVTDMGGKIGVPNLGSVVEETIGKDIGIRYDTAAGELSDDTVRLMDGKKLDYHATRATHEEALKVSMDDLSIRDSDGLATVKMKRTLTEQRNWETRIAETQKKLSAARAAKRPGEIDRWTEVLDEQREGLSRAKLNATAMRDATKAELAKLDDEFRIVSGGIRDNGQRGKELIDALKHKKLGGQQIADAVRLHRRFEDEGLIGWDSLTEGQKAEMIAKSPQGRVYLMDKETVDGAIQHYQDLRKPDMLRSNPIMRGLAKFTQIWSAWTVTNPLFLNSRVRDTVTGLLMLGHGGGNPLGSGAAGAAWDISRAWQKNLNRGIPMEKSLAGKSVTRFAEDGTKESWELNKILKFLYSRGQVGSGMARDEVAQSLNGMVTLTGSPTIADIGKTFWRIDPHKNAMLKAGYQVANFGDDWVKTIGFIDAWKRFGDPETALQWTRKWTYNPMRSTTGFERSFIKPIIPFYSWLKFSTGKTVEQLFTKPGTVTWLDKLSTVAHQSPPGSLWDIMSGDWDEGGKPLDERRLESIVPEFIRDGLGVPYKNSPEGPRYFLLGGYLPAAEINKSADAIRSIFSSKPEDQNALVRYWVGQMNPLIKTTVEQVMNRDLFSNSEIADYPGQQSEMFGVPMPARMKHLMRNVRLISELDKLNVLNLQELRAGANAVERGAKLGSRTELPLVERFLGSAFGVQPKSYQVDIAEDLRRARRTAEQRINELKGRLRYAVENQSTQANAENVKVLQDLLADEMAVLAEQEAIAAAYGVPAKLERKRGVSLRSLQQPRQPTGR